jgi:hypothetical protein
MSGIDFGRSGSESTVYASLWRRRGGDPSEAPRRFDPKGECGRGSIRASISCPSRTNAKRSAEQFRLSTQPRPVQLGDWDHGTRHRSRQKRDIRRDQVDRTRFSRNDVSKA